MMMMTIQTIHRAETEILDDDNTIQTIQRAETEILDDDDII